MTAMEIYIMTFCPMLFSKPHVMDYAILHTNDNNEFVTAEDHHMNQNPSAEN